MTLIREKVETTKRPRNEQVSFINKSLKGLTAGPIKTFLLRGRENWPWTCWRFIITHWLLGSKRHGPEMRRGGQAWTMALIYEDQQRAGGAGETGSMRPGTPWVTPLHSVYHSQATSKGPVSLGVKRDIKGLSSFHIIVPMWHWMKQKIQIKLTSNSRVSFEKVQHYCYLIPLLCYGEHC